MKRKKALRIAAVTVIFLIIAAVVIAAAIRISGEKKTNIIKISPDEADVRIQDFVYTEMGQGNFKWEVRAKTAQYQKKINLAVFDQVQIKLTTSDGKVYIMTGDEGRMQTEKKDVELKGHVVITSDAGDTFTTDYLRYSDTQKKVHTDAPVMMEGKQMKIQGTGLSIFIDKGEILLSSGVKAKIN